MSHWLFVLFVRHLKKGRKFGRTRNQRRALIKSIASSFFISGKIKTTEAKAKEAKPMIEKWITRAKNPTLANKRFLGRTFSPALVKRIERYAADAMDRKGGYTRIIKTGRRMSDSSRMAILEIVK